MQIGLYESSWFQEAFVPEEPANDMRAVTVNDELSTMFPAPREFETQVAPATDCLFCDTTRNWLMAGAALVVFWSLRKRRR